MSPWEQQRVRSLVADAGKVVVCMRGVDLRRFAPRDGAGRPCRRFLYVGRKSFEKGYDLMEEAASIVGAKQPAVEFVFAGNFNVGESGNRKYVGFVQPEDLPALYASVDAVILPSRSEGFPQVLAEAMAMGKPCIVPEVPFGAMFRHEHDVLLTQTGGESLAHAVLRLHADPALCRKLAEASLRFARAELDRDRWRAAYRSNILGAA
jgi:glycosyltransferase involved in cell wall biosynthesis